MITDALLREDVPLTSLWRRALRSWCSLLASSCLCLLGSTSTRSHTLKTHRKGRTVRTLLAIFVIKEILVKTKHAYNLDWPEMWIFGTIKWKRVHGVFFFKCCSKSPHPPEGALTPAGWRSHERPPSWCCGSDLSPPLCSPHMARWRGCPEKPPAEPGERRRRRRRRRRGRRERKEGGDRDGRKNRQDDGKTEVKEKSPWRRQKGQMRERRKTVRRESVMMRGRRKERETYLKPSISRHHVVTVQQDCKFLEKWPKLKQLNFQYRMMCFSACALLCSRLRCDVQSRVRPSFTQHTEPEFIGKDKNTC